MLIRGGLIFNGSGTSRIADVAIRDGHILAIAPALDHSADQVVDASGMWVMPGFVDIHTHYDLEVEIAPGLSESVRHGVTAVVIGGCSLSTIYGEPADLAHIFSRVETLPEELVDKWLTRARSWTSASGYFEHLRSLKLVPRVACMLGHSALRVKVMGLERSLHDAATKQELEVMRVLAEDALKAGCIGISVDMVHWHRVAGPFAGRSLPSHHARFAEYAMLADVCRKYDAVFQVTPNPQNLFSFWNILRLCPGVWRAPLRITILSALDIDGAPCLWWLYAPLLFLCNQLLGCNIRFQTLAEPFTVYADGYLTPLFEEFPAGVKLNNCRTLEQRRALWKDGAFRAEFASNWRWGFPKTFHRDLRRMVIVSAPDASLEGKSIAAAAAERGLDPLEYFMTLLELYDQQLRWRASSANNRVVVRQKLMEHPHILPGFSDAGAHSRNLAYFDGALSVIRQSVATKFISLEKAVARVSSEPARWFNLQTGQLKAGWPADLVVMNPEKLQTSIPEAVTICDPVLGGASRMVKRDEPAAIERVFISGVEVVRAGAPLPVPELATTGSVLTQSNPTASKEECLARYRNRISDDTALMPQSDYWPVFLLKHQHPGNVALHCAGFLLMYLIPLAAICVNNWLILLMPLSQITGLAGHFLFERSPVDTRDTVFSWRAFLSLHRMFFCVIAGRYWREVDSARREYAAAGAGMEAAPPTSSITPVSPS